MDFEHLAKKFINDHNKPIIKIEIFGSKLFLEPLNAEQQQLKDKCLLDIENKLRHDRVERRLARSLAEWSPTENNAKVLKTTGSMLANFGTGNKNGKFLNSEETAVLLETNKLELRYKNIPISIEETYKNILNSQDFLRKYLVYKKLVLQGYKLKKTEVTDDGPSAKKLKLEPIEEKHDFSEIFQKLQEKGPRIFQNDNECEKPDYYIHSEKSERFKLFVMNEEEFSSKYADDNGLNICGSFDGIDLSFYKFINSHIKNL